MNEITLAFVTGFAVGGFLAGIVILTFLPIQREVSEKLCREIPVLGECTKWVAYLNNMRTGRDKSYNFSVGDKVKITICRL